MSVQAEKVIEALGVDNRPFLEITLNLPRTAAFLKSNSFSQKKIYSNKFNLIISALLNTYGTSRYTFEYCRDGQIHLHGIIYLAPNVIYCPVGLLSDAVKAYLNTLSPKFRVFKPGAVRYYDNDNTVKYTDASICASYRLDQLKREVEWSAYMDKFVGKI